MTHVRDVMTRKVLCIKSGTTLRNAAVDLLKHNITGAPVLDEAGKLIGIVSEKDLFKALYPSHMEFYESPGVWLDMDDFEKRAKMLGEKRVDDVMSKAVVTVNADTSIMQVGSIMLVRGVHRVVVVGQDEKVLGIVSRGDIFHTVLRKQLGI